MERRPSDSLYDEHYLFIRDWVDNDSVQDNCMKDEVEELKEIDGGSSVNLVRGRSKRRYLCR